MYSLALSGERRTVPGPLRTKKIAVGSRFDPLPFQEYRLGAPLAARNADRLAVNGLHFRINARARPIPKPVAHHLRQMKHEFVVVFELIMLNADHRTVIGDAD